MSVPRDTVFLGRWLKYTLAPYSVRLQPSTPALPPPKLNKFKTPVEESKPVLTMFRMTSTDNNSNVFWRPLPPSTAGFAAQNAQLFPEPKFSKKVAPQDYSVLLKRPPKLLCQYPYSRSVGVYRIVYIIVFVYWFCLNCCCVCIAS